MSVSFFDPEVAYANDQNLKKDDVKALLKWVHNQPHLPKINEAQAIPFLQRWDYRQDLVHNAIDSYFTIRTICPDLFSGRDPFQSPFKETLDVSCITMLPKKTPEGYNILFYKLLDSNVDHYDFGLQIKYLNTVLSTNLYQQGPFQNYVILFDMNGYPYEVLDKLHPLKIKKYLYFLQEIMPLSLKRFHFVNITQFYEDFITLMKPSMKKELANSLYAHRTVDDLVKYVPRACLPKDYGGPVDSIASLHDKTKKMFLESAALFEWEDQQTVDEKQRPASSKIFETLVTITGSPQNGSFTFADVQSEYYKDPKLRKEDVKELIEWTHNQPHLPRIAELQAILFLKKSHYQKETAKEALDSYFTYRTQHSNIFLKRNPFYSPFKEAPEDCLVTVLPEETPEGNRIIFVKLYQKDDLNVLVQLRQVDTAVSLDLYKKGSNKGYVFVIDVGNMFSGFILKLDAIHLKTFFHYWLQIAPVDISEIHYFNLNSLFKEYLSVLQPVVPQKIFWYDSVDDLIKRFSKNCLPEDYGGLLESVEALNEKSKHDLLANVALFDWEDTQTVNETRRPKESKILENILAVTKSFQEGNKLTFADVDSLYRKNKNLKKEDVKTIVEWVHNQPHLPEINEIQAIVFLQRWQYQVEVAKNALDSYFTYKTFNADIFLGRNPLSPSFMDTLDVCLFVMLPTKTPEGYSIMFGKFLNFDVDYYDSCEQIKHADMLLSLHAYQEGPSNGFQLIFDINNVPFEIMPKFVPYTVRRIYHYLWEVAPLKLRGIHYINTHTLEFSDDFKDLLKSLTSENFIESLYFHKDVDDLVEYVPMECLPKDYGGTAESTSVLQEIKKKKFLANAPLFVWEDQQTVDEHKRSYKHKTLKDILAIIGTPENESALSHKSEYARDRNLKRQDVKEVIDWVHHQPHLPKINEIQAVRFLQRWQYQVEITKNALDSYFTFKTFCSDTFLCRNPSLLNHVLDFYCFTILPKKTPEGYNILFGKSLVFDTEHFNIPDIVKIVDMITMLHLYQEDSSTECIFVGDMRDFSQEALPKMDVVSVKRHFYYVQEVAPVLWKAYHTIYPSPFANEYLNIIKPSLKGELADNFYVHDNFEDLLKYVPLECLPADYGGSADSIAVLHEKTKSKLLANAALFEWEDTQTVKEHLRSNKYKTMKDILAVARSAQKSNIVYGQNGN